MAFLAVSTAYHSAPSSELVWFFIGAGGIVAWIVIVAGAASAANARDARRYGRADAHTQPDDGFVTRSTIGGTYYRPWDDLYQRRGYDSSAELAAAEAASASRSEPSAALAGQQVAGGSTPIGSAGAAPKDDGA